MSVAAARAKMIAVTGKGGVGKSTISALITRYLKENAEGPILALDADPDANLATLLGMSQESTIGDLREDVLKQMKNWPAGMSKDAYIQAGLHQIIVEGENLDLVTMGRGEGPSCYCYINNLLRKFADDLMPSYQWIVMDNEAGLENLSRRTATHIHHLIVVVNENPLAIDCARRIDALLDDLSRGVDHRHVVLNAVRPGREDAVRAKLADLSLKYLGAVPRDDALEEAVFAGKPIDTLVDSAAVRAVCDMMKRIGED